MSVPGSKLDYASVILSGKVYTNDKIRQFIVEKGIYLSPPPDYGGDDACMRPSVTITSLCPPI
jgi:hypothetical protein